jgi:hypothetical protein
MSYHTWASRGQSFELIRQGFLDAEGLPFSNLLSAEQIQRAFEEADALFGQEEDDRYTPALTLWGFLSQALHSGTERSCNAAVERIRSLCVTLDLDAPSSDSGAYCRARAKIPEAVLQRLTYAVADALEAQVPKEWLRFGRPVKIADGSTLLTPDTDQNQAAWPQAPTQQPGLGFPILRFCALFSLATGALCGFAEGPYCGKETGETALLRLLFGCLRAGYILLGDSYFCSYFMIALLLELGVDVVFHQHQRRTTDFRQGKSLGPEDHLVVWPKPERPSWMDEATYARMPDQLEVRELRQKVSIPEVSEAGGRRAVSGTLARRAGLAFGQGHVGLGGSAGNLSGDGAERDLGALAGLQPDPQEHGGGGRDARVSAAADQLRRGGADRGGRDGTGERRGAVPVASLGGAEVGVDRQSPGRKAAPPRGTAGHQTSP